MHGTWTGRGSRQRGLGWATRPGPTQPSGHLQAGSTGPGSLSVLSLQKHSLSASLVPGTVLGTRETAQEQGRQKCLGDRVAGEGCKADGLRPLIPAGLPPTYPRAGLWPLLARCPSHRRMPMGVFTASSQSGVVGVHSAPGGWETGHPGVGPGLCRPPGSGLRKGGPAYLMQQPISETVTMPSHSLRFSPWTSSRAWFCRSNVGDQRRALPHTWPISPPHPHPPPPLLDSRALAPSSPPS